MERFEKLKISARYFLLGLAEHDHSYHKVMEAMELMLQLHTGQRNGGEPEAIHQLGIFHNARIFHKQLRDPINTYITIFLHDAGEDKNLSISTVREKFGETAAHTFDLISKEVDGIKKDASIYLENVFSNPVSAVAKAFDRVNNVSTMVGVFKPDRLARYVKETEEQFLPRLKAARRMFPDQETIFEAVKMELEHQLKLIKVIQEGNKE